MSDLTITRAHIDEVQASRLLAGEEPFTPEELVTDFVRWPQARHYERARRLMAPRPGDPPPPAPVAKEAKKKSPATKGQPS